MNSERKMETAEKYVTLLKLIDESGGGSMGAGKAQEMLSSAGVDVSEPTAGRALRDLERAGYLEKNGRHGRKLTPAGADYIRERRRGEEKLRVAEEFARNLYPRENAELVDLLTARRAIEMETAKLAARQISPEDVHRLRENVLGSVRLMREKKSVASLDTEFHGIIARASGNRTLASVLEVIWHGGEHARKLERIRYHSKEMISDDHANIVNALSIRDPQAAAFAMERHIDNVLREVIEIPEDVMKKVLGWAEPD